MVDQSEITNFKLPLQISIFVKIKPQSTNVSVTLPNTTTEETNKYCWMVEMRF